MYHFWIEKKSYDTLITIMELKEIRINELQQTIQQVIADLGGYWDPLAAFTRVAEELGELAQAMLENNQAALTCESADLFIITTSIANQYVANLGEEYEKMLPLNQEISLLNLQCCAGELGRRLNHYEGLKKPKKDELIKSVQTIVAEFHQALFQFAKQNNISLMKAVYEQLNMQAQRDKHRFEINYDPALTFTRNIVLPFLTNTPLSKKLWCSDNWNPQLDLSQNIQQHFLKTYQRFCKIYPYEQLTALTFVMPQAFGLNQTSLNHTIDEVLNLLPKQEQLDLISFAPCLTHPYASPDNTIIVFTPKNLRGNDVFN